MRHTIGKILKRAISVLQTSFQSKVGDGSYELPKSQKVQTGTISGLHLGSPGTKSHSDAGAVGERREYYMGEGGGFPRVRVMMSQVSPRLPMACPEIRVCRMSFNHFLVGFGCRTE
jgi:hypothetical protein